MCIGQILRKGGTGDRGRQEGQEKGRLRGLSAQQLTGLVLLFVMPMQPAATHTLHNSPSPPPPYLLSIPPPYIHTHP